MPIASPDAIAAPSPLVTRTVSTEQRGGTSTFADYLGAQAGVSLIGHGEGNPASAIRIGDGTVRRGVVGTHASSAAEATPASKNGSDNPNLDAKTGGGSYAPDSESSSSSNAAGVRGAPPASPRMPGAALAATEIGDPQTDLPPLPVLVNEQSAVNRSTVKTTKNSDRSGTDAQDANEDTTAASVASTQSPGALLAVAQISNHTGNDADRGAGDDAGSGPEEDDSTGDHSAAVSGSIGPTEAGVSDNGTSQNPKLSRIVGGARIVPSIIPAGLSALPRVSDLEEDDRKSSANSAALSNDTVTALRSPGTPANLTTQALQGSPQFSEAGENYEPQRSQGLQKPLGLQQSQGMHETKGTKKAQTSSTSTITSIAAQSTLSPSAPSQATATPMAAATVFPTAAAQVQSAVVDVPVDLFAVSAVEARGTAVAADRAELAAVPRLGETRPLEAGPSISGLTGTAADGNVAPSVNDKAGPANVSPADLSQGVTSADATANASTPSPTTSSVPTSTPVPSTVDASHTAAAVRVADVPVTVAAQAHAGNSRFEIRLDPPDLGRVDVKLSFDGSGNVNAHLIVERADTLDLLRQDAPQLDRTLQNAGFNTGDGAQFSLADQGFANRNWHASQADYTVRTPIVTPSDDPTSEILAGYAASNSRSSGLDITV